ncbi:hypothetical protein TWF281_004440 [Arthrobotrys megalospora]
MASVTLFPFLRLPRELRDKVYEHCINSPPPAKIQLPYFGRYKWPTLNTALMRVNKQVHDEVASQFYSRTVFPITISMTVDMFSGMIQGRGSTYYISYYAPWEGMFFVFNDTDTTRRRLYALSSPGQLYEEEFRIPYDLELSGDLSGETIRAIAPARRYLNLIRRIRFEIYDSWPLGGGPAYEYPVWGGTRQNLTRLLMPLAYRLEKVFGVEAANKIDVELNAAACFCEAKSPSEQLPRMWSGHGEVGGVRPYDDFVKTMAPLTTGSWVRGYTFNLEMPALKFKYPDLEDTIRRKLDKASERLQGNYEERDTGEWPAFDR